MAREQITMTDGGFGAWIDELETAAEKMPEVMLLALQERQEVIEDAIRSEWVSLGGSFDGFVYSSVGQSSAYSKENSKDVVGTVGVYDVNSVKQSFGKTNKDLNAAQIAYWTEHGTSRLRFGGRKDRDVEYPDEMLVTTQPKPFIMNAVYKSWDNAEKAFRNKFNEEYQRLVK